MKKSDDQIIKIVNKHNAMTETELLKALKYKQLHNRLKTLVKKGKLQYIIIADNRACKHKFFAEYTGMKLYYTDEKHLCKWIKKHTPRFTSIPQQRAFTMRVKRDFRIDKPHFTIIH